MSATPKQRTAIGALVLSAATLVGIATHEAYRGDAYLPTPNDVPTIGWGTTEGVKLGEKTEPTRALVRLLADAGKFERAVRRCADVPLHQHEFDAFVSLAYNIGEGAFCNSTLVRKLRVGDYPGACREILRWDRQAGKVLRGLTVRRQAEYRQCIGEEAAK
jgi:lysozyme